MNLQEFAALKVGDKIENPMTGSQGEVTETTSNGVRVTWGPHGDNVHGFLYPAHSTAWMHWSKASKQCPNGGPCTSERCEAADQCLGGTKEQYNNLAK